MLVTMFDTAMHSDNLGDEIIMESVWEIARDVFPDAVFKSVPTHRPAPLNSLIRGRRSDISIVGGTNILKSRMFYNGNWRITPADLLAWRNVVLLGTGWRTYGNDPDLATKIFLRTILARNFLHSVRDEYTYQKLSKFLPNVVYTGCPTMWTLTPERCAKISTSKASSAIFSVTYYHANPERDLAIFELIKRRYKRVYIWRQQSRDSDYIRELGLDGYTMIEPHISAYDNILANNDIDCIGSRLHGGIRALQHGRRALIFGVDNRAVEIAKSSNLTVMSRDDLSRVDSWIQNPVATRLTLPWESIQMWKRQFRETGSHGSADLALRETSGGS